MESFLSTNGRSILIAFVELGQEWNWLPARSAAMMAEAARAAKAARIAPSDFTFGTARGRDSRASPATMAANHSPKPTCLNRLTKVWILACSAGARQTAPARVRPSSLYGQLRNLYRTTTAPTRPRPPTNPAQPKLTITTPSGDEVAVLRSKVVQVMPCQ